MFARLAAIIADLVVISITLLSTYQQQAHAVKAGIKVPLTTMLIRDGA